MDKKRISKFVSLINKARRNEAKIKTTCEDQLRYYKKVFTMNTVRTNISLCRREIKKIDPNHIALKYINLSDDDWAEFRSKYSKQVEANLQDRNLFDQIEFVNVCEALVSDYLNGKHKSYQKLSIGMAGLTGRRIFSEILIYGRFEIVDRDHLLFSGQAKSRDKSGGLFKKPYTIPALADTELIYEGWLKLREKSWNQIDYAKHFLKKITKNSMAISADQHHALFEKKYDYLVGVRQKIKDSVSKDVSKLVKKIFDDKEMQAKSLRTMYAVTAYNKFADIKTYDETVYIKNILGHSEGDLQTAHSYKQCSIIYFLCWDHKCEWKFQVNKKNSSINLLKN